MSAALGMGMVLGLLGLSGCSSGPEGPSAAPVTKSRRDEIQKAREQVPSGGNAPAKKARAH